MTTTAASYTKTTLTQDDINWFCDWLASINIFTAG